MRIIHVSLTIQNSAAYDAQIVIANGTINLPSFARYYLISAQCKVSVRDAVVNGNPLMYQGSDSYGWYYDAGIPNARTFSKMQGFDADIALRNNDGTVPITPQEVTYTASTGSQTQLNYNLYINPVGQYVPREPILLNLNPNYVLGIDSRVRYASHSAVNLRFASSADVYAFTSVILELGCDNT